MNELQERIARAKGWRELTYTPGHGLSGMGPDGYGMILVPDWPRDMNAAMELWDEIEANEDVTETVLHTDILKTAKEVRLIIHRYGKGPIMGRRATVRVVAICQAYLAWREMNDAAK